MLVWKRIEGKSSKRADPVAQWIERQIADLQAAGSNPVGIAFCETTSKVVSLFIMLVCFRTICCPCMQICMPCCHKYIRFRNLPSYLLSYGIGLLREKQSIHNAPALLQPNMVENLCNNLCARIVAHSREMLGTRYNAILSG